MPEEDGWPDTDRERYDLLVRLDSRARRFIKGRVSDVVRRHAVVDEATLSLLARLLANEPPEKPWAWLRTAVSRSGRTAEGVRLAGAGVTDDRVSARVQSNSCADSDEALSRRLRAWLDENLEDVLASASLTTYQEAVVRQLLTDRDFATAARSLSKDPRHVRVAWRRTLAKLHRFYGPHADSPSASASSKDEAGPRSV